MNCAENESDREAKLADSISIVVQGIHVAAAATATGRQPVTFRGVACKYSENEIF